MKYNFDSVIDRKNTNSLKWDLFDDEYPMWVADMDFYAAPLIYESVNRKAKHGVYAYSFVNDAVFDSYVNWWKKYGLSMKKEELLFANGVMPSITSIIRAFTDVGDNVLIQTPVYHVFFYVIEDNDRNVVENELIYNPESSDVETAYKIDFDDLEEKFKDPKTKLMLLCNPHNPIGKIWDKESLEKIAVLANEYDVIVVSDEIHCDLTDPNLKYLPFASLDNELSKNSITCISPSKTFNIAGLQSSAVFTRNKEFYEILKKQLAIDCFAHPNIFAIDATIVAYKSEDWLNELREVIFANKMIVDEFLNDEIPEIRLVPANATSLLWLDISKLNTDYNTDSNAFSEFLREEVGLFL
ncbi:MAG: aminotransferase class I/II-fold pyridoxal phosphate-dependent enzyme, partial [Methanobrevibacter sp.]|nr:aminotransferase class I/II-fold pyridoxal phosphate-dependent enzyme [Methanobrevibacter sp.]